VDTTHIRPSLHCDLGSTSKTFVEFNKFTYKSLEKQICDYDIMIMNNIILGYINNLEIRSKYDLQQCPKKNCSVSPAERNNHIHKSWFS
jgi:hypothetical protein